MNSDYVANAISFLLITWFEPILKNQIQQGIYSKGLSRHMLEEYLLAKTANILQAHVASQNYIKELMEPKLLFSSRHVAWIKRPLSAAELAAAHKAARVSMDTIDEDCNGSIDVNEWIEQGGSVDEFNRLDTNHDGVLDLQELEVLADEQNWHLQYCSITDRKKACTSAIKGLVLVVGNRVEPRLDWNQFCRADELFAATRPLVNRFSGTAACMSDLAKRDTECTSAVCSIQQKQSLRSLSS